MSAALAYLDDDFQMPRRARHLYLVALNGQVIASQANRSRAACMRTGTSALPLHYSNSHVYNKGLLLRETLFDASTGTDKPYIETVNSYDFWKLRDSPTSSIDPLSLERFTYRATAVLFPRLIGSSKAYYEGSSEAGQSSYTTHVYDALGNITHFTEGGSGVEEVRATIDYENCADSYIVGKPKVISVKTSAGEVRRREGDFDCTTGTLTKQRAFIDTGKYAETSFFWDGYGNLDNIEGPAKAPQVRAAHSS